MKDNFVFCDPEEAGVRSCEIIKLINNLEKDYSEIHSLIIYKDGKIITEGYLEAV